MKRCRHSWSPTDEHDYGTGDGRLVYACQRCPARSYRMFRGRQIVHRILAPR